MVSLLFESVMVKEAAVSTFTALKNSPASTVTFSIDETLTVETASKLSLMPSPSRSLPQSRLVLLICSKDEPTFNGSGSSMYGATWAVMMSPGSLLPRLVTLVSLFEKKVDSGPSPEGFDSLKIVAGIPPTKVAPPIEATFSYANVARPVDETVPGYVKFIPCDRGK